MYLLFTQLRTTAAAAAFSPAIAQERVVPTPVPTDLSAEPDDVTIAESGAIIEYLVDKYDDGTLRPEAGTPERLAYGYAIEANLSRPFSRLFNPARWVRKIGVLFGGDHVPVAGDVNALDEVLGHPPRLRVAPPRLVDADGVQEVICGGVCYNGDGTVRWHAEPFGHTDISKPARNTLPPAQMISGMLNRQTPMLPTMSITGTS